MEDKQCVRSSGDTPGKKLRNGFTTGTCAAAAAKAAAVLLCEKNMGIEFRDYSRPVRLTILTPAGVAANMEAQIVSQNSQMVSCQVEKDAGDDPDVTDKAWIQAEVKWMDRDAWEEEIRKKKGYRLEAYPQYYLTGGKGVGIVTKQGLSCPPGSYAINPVPQEMIIGAVANACLEAGIARYTGICISVAGGERLALQTFNPKLGIIGGISIIGTTGIVKPMSEEALLETIKLELHMKAIDNKEPVFVVPGNYGLSFLERTLLVPQNEAVVCSNYIADTMRFAVNEGISRLLLIGHIGKFIKVAGGMRNTHSRYGDGRMELLADIAMRHQKELGTLIRTANTTEEAIGILVRHQLGECVLNETAKAVKRQTEEWTAHRIQIEVVTFSSAYGILGKTSRVVAWLEEWNRRWGGKVV